MANTILILTEDALKRVFVGLGELPAKISHELINELEAQVALIEKDVGAYVAQVEQHLLPHKAKVPAVVTP